MYSFVILSKAIADTNELHSYYKNKSIELGERFMNAFDECLHSIERFPFSNQKQFKEKRQALFDIFPVAMIYEIENETIIVYSLFHTSKNPDDKF